MRIHTTSENFPTVRLLRRRRTAVIDAPDFERMALRILDEHFADGSIATDVRRRLGLEIVDALRIVWNGRGVCDLVEAGVRVVANAGGGEGRPLPRSAESSAPRSRQVRAQGPNSPEARR